jgi:hypothetical protein
MIPKDLQKLRVMVGLHLLIVFKTIIWIMWHQEKFLFPKEMVDTLNNIKLFNWIILMTNLKLIKYSQQKIILVIHLVLTQALWEESWLPVIQSCQPKDNFLLSIQCILQRIATVRLNSNKNNNKIMKHKQMVTWNKLIYNKKSRYFKQGKI